MIVTARQFTSAAEMRAAAVAVHRRCFSPKIKPNATLQIEPVLKPVKAKVVEKLWLPKEFDSVPLWKQFEIKFDAHVISYKAWLKEQNPSRISVKNYIINRCDELGVDYLKTISASRKFDYARPRQLIMWEIKRRFKPDISYPQIGAHFGGRDHTTVLHAVRKYDKIMGWQP